MNAQTFIFSGTMKSEQPLTVSLPGLSGLPRNGGYKSGRYFPSSTIRGVIRHAAHAAVLKMTKAQAGEPHPFTVDEHFMLAQGVVREDAGSDKSDTVDAGNVLRMKNPFLSVFGRWGLESKLSVGNAIPLSADSWGVFGKGVRSEIFARNPALLDELSNDDKTLLDVYKNQQHDTAEAMKPLKKDIATLKKAYKLATPAEKDELSAQIKALETQINELKKAKVGHKESILRPIDGYEAFAAGSEFEHKMILRGATDVELGLLVLALQQLSKDPSMGGHKAQGNGLVSFSWTVKTWLNDDDAAPVKVGEIGLSMEDGLLVDGDLLASAVESFKKSFANFNFKMAFED